MYLSLDWLNEFVDSGYDTAQMDYELTMLGIEVEAVIDYKKKYDKFFTAKVLKKEAHPDADKLSLCTVKYGDMEQRVVCGAPNVAEGQSVVLGTIGAVVPNGGFELRKAKIRGVESAGMICSQTELDLGTDGSGIWVLPEGTEDGQALADYLDMNDVVFEISLTPNKQDCLSHMGVGRDLAAKLGKQLNLPDFSIEEGDSPVEEDITIEIEDKDNCPRYAGRVVKGVKMGPSPAWIRNRLVKAGLRPLNLAADVTNYVLLELGQPLHAFDLNHLAGPKIVVKPAKDGDKFTTLDGKERTLDSKMLMICDAEKPVAIAGVMGGENSEITDETTDILLESAYFHPSSVRRTSKKLALSTDASYRFERGTDICYVPIALDRAAKLIAELGGGTVSKGRADIYPETIAKREVVMNFDKARRLIGVDIDNDFMVRTLNNLQFETLSLDDNELKVSAPYHRYDVTYDVDLIEDIARLYNYDNIEPHFDSSVDINSSLVHESLSVPKMGRRISDFMINRGFHEIMTQNQIDPDSAALFGEEPIEIANPLGVELSRMRTSLIPSVLRSIERNIRLGNTDLRMFEIGKTFHKAYKDEKTFVEGFRESQELVVIMTGKNMETQWADGKRDADFYDIKGITEDLMRFLRAEGIKMKVSADKTKAFSANSLAILSGKKNQIGRVGEISKAICKKYDIGIPVFMLILDMAKLKDIKTTRAYYSQVPPFPGMSRDLAFVLCKDSAAAAVANLIEQNGGKFLTSVVIFDVYEGKNLGQDKKSLAFKLNFQSPERTLTDAEIEKDINKIVGAVEKKFNAELRKF